MATLVDLTIDALWAYLLDEYSSDPPVDVPKPTIHRGRWLDDPEEVSPLITLHENNQQDVASVGSEDWPHKRIFDGPDYWQEMGDGPCTFNMYMRYSVRLQYFMTLSGEDQPDALKKNRELVSWLSKKLSKADVATLQKFGLREDDYGYTPIKITINKWNTREGGGPPSSYIQRTVFFLEQLAQFSG